MFWLVPRPASLNDTVSAPALFRLPLALMKCSFCANAGTAARASAISDSTAIMPIFLIKVFLLYLVGLYCSLRIGACLRHCLRAVECLFAGAGRSCVCPYIAKQASGPWPSYDFLLS